jgi:hypothetical protein
MPINQTQTWTVLELAGLCAVSSMAAVFAALHGNTIFGGFFVAAGAISVASCVLVPHRRQSRNATIAVSLLPQRHRLMDQLMSLCVWEDIEAGGDQYEIEEIINMADEETGGA